jgi:hypothetical protein
VNGFGINLCHDFVLLFMDVFAPDSHANGHDFLFLGAVARMISGIMPQLWGAVLAAGLAAKALREN